MIKQIKFNLFMDNKPVRTIEELQDNFNFSDLIEYYKNGILKRWLTVRNLNQYVLKLDGIKTDDDLLIAEELVKIFYHSDDISTLKEKIKESVYPIIYERKKRDDLKIIEDKKYANKQIISKYHDEYNALLVLLKENKEDFPFIKSTIQKIFSDYIGIFKYHVYDFYFTEMHDSPLVILSVLANKNLRSYFLDFPQIKKDLSKYFETSYYSEKFKNLKVNGVDIDEGNYLMKYVKLQGKATNQYWIDLEDKGKEYMIIHIQNGNFTRNFGNTSEQLGSNEINNNFVILNGINYMSNNENHKIVYMEI